MSEFSSGVSAQLAETISRYRTRLAALLNDGLTLVGFLLTGVASILAGHDKVLPSHIDWTRPPSGPAILFWSLITTGGMLLLVERSRQRTREHDMDGAIGSAREEAATLRERMDDALAYVGRLEQGQRDAEAHAKLRADELASARADLKKLNEMTGQLQQSAAVANERAMTESRARGLAEVDLREAMAKLIIQGETLPPDGLLNEHAVWLVGSMNLLLDSIRTPLRTARTARINDRIRTVLGWMARAVRRYNDDPRDVAFGAHLSLYYRNATQAGERGDPGLIHLPALYPGSGRGFLITSPELSARIPPEQPDTLTRDARLRPCTWPVGIPGRGTRPGPRAEWLPGPQTAWAGLEGSQMDDVMELDDWASQYLIPHSNAAGWKQIRSYLQADNEVGIRSLVSYPVTQHDAKSHMMRSLGVVTLYATRPRMLPNDIRSARLASLLTPFRVILAQLLVRRAQVDPSRWVEYEAALHWHNC